MFIKLGLNSGSLMSARNLSRSLTSPSYSVLTNRSATNASRACESRWTCASFHRCSNTISLLCWAAESVLPVCDQAEEASSRAQMAGFIAIVLITHPHQALTDARNHSNPAVSGSTKSAMFRLRMSSRRWRFSASAEELLLRETQRDAARLRISFAHRVNLLP